MQIRVIYILKTLLECAERPRNWEGVRAVGRGLRALKEPGISFPR